MRNPEKQQRIEPRHKEHQHLASRASRIFFPLVRLGVGVAIILYLAKSGIIDWRGLSKLFTQWPITMAAVALLLLDVALIALRLCWLFRPLGLRLPFYNSMQLTLVSFFFGTFLPGAAGGDVARVFYATKGNSGRRTEIITVLLFDRALGLFSLLILPLFFAPLFPQLLRELPVVRILLFAVALLAAGMLCAFLILVFSPHLMDCCASLVRRLIPRLGKLDRIFGTIHETMTAYRHTPRALAAALGISLIANLSLIAVTALGVLALKPASWTAKMFIMIPMGHVVNSLPLTPGGLGVGETAFDALFEIAGLRGGADALLCWRIWRALVSMLGLAVYLRGFKLAIFDQEPIPSNNISHAGSGLPSERCETP